MIRRAAAIAHCVLALAGCSRQTASGGPPDPSVAPSSDTALTAQAKAPVVSASAPPPTSAPSSSAAPAAAPCEDLVQAGPGTAPRLDALPADRLRGVDVSSLAPWRTLRDAGFVFAFAAATYGLTRNTAFPANWAMMKRCGLLRGAYHRITEKGDGAAQARAFLEAIDGDPGELPPVVDVEKPSCAAECCGLSCAAWTKIATSFVEAVTARVSRKPIVYLVEPFLSECACGTRALASHPLWLAGWPKADFRDVPRTGGFARWTFYQHATNVRAGGTAIDLDLFRGTARDLERFAAGDDAGDGGRLPSP